MITELKSVRDVWKKMPTQHHARAFLEGAIWGDERFCPHPRRNQKTAWKLGHAIREFMDDRDRLASRLSGVVEVDEALANFYRRRTEREIH